MYKRRSTPYIMQRIISRIQTRLSRNDSCPKAKRDTATIIEKR